MFSFTGYILPQKTSVHGGSALVGHIAVSLVSPLLLRAVSCRAGHVARATIHIHSTCM